MSKLDNLNDFIDFMTDHYDEYKDQVGFRNDEADTGELWETWKKIYRFHEKNPSTLDLED